MGSLLEICEEGSFVERILENVYRNSCGVLIKKRKVSATRVFPHGCGPNAPRMYVSPHVDKEEKKTDKKKRSIIFKKRKVSANRVFPPGCGRNAPRMYIFPHFENEKIGVDKKFVDVAVSDCWEYSQVGNTSGLDKSIDNLVVKMANEAVVNKEDELENRTLLDTAKKWTVTQWPIKTLDILKESSLELKYKIRRVSAIREFPPFCGRNAPYPTKEECLKLLNVNKSSEKRKKNSMLK